MRKEAPVKKKRISVVDLVRFIAAVAIVWLHSAYIRYEDNTTSFHFTGTFMFVELFFILMGYFTFAHFNRKKYLKANIDEKFTNSLKYTIKKFIVFMPYVIIAILLFYLVQSISINCSNTREIIDFFKKLPSEILLIGSQFNGRLGLVWYISASFIVFPIFCTLCQAKNQRALFVVMLLSCIVYYTNFDFSIIGIPALFRAFFGLSLGILVFFASKKLSEYDFKKCWTYFFSIVELLAFVFSIMLMYPADRGLMYDIPYRTVIMLGFVIALILLLSGKTVQSKIESKLFEFLGKLSLQIYLFHLILVEAIYLYANHLPTSTKMIIVYVGTLFISIAIYAIVEQAKRSLPSARIIFLKNSN